MHLCNSEIPFYQLLGIIIFFYIKFNVLPMLCFGKLATTTGKQTQLDSFLLVSLPVCKIGNIIAFMSETILTPRVRGKVFIERLLLIFVGITPACAGKSICTSSMRPCGRDHPRVCGEKAVRFSHALRLVGSPPRVRGKGSLRPPPPLPQGITPACAGKSPAHCP